MCDACFDTHVALSCGQGNAVAFGRAPRIFCPMHPCTAQAPGAGAAAAAQQQLLPFADRQVALHVEDATLQAYQEARRGAHLAQGQREGQELARAQQQQQRQPQGGGQQLQQQQQERLQQARTAIINTALTLVPPCCRGGAVADWDACFAVRCQWCPSHFCGFCFEYSGSEADTHAHVRGCRLRMPGSQQGRGYFAAPGEAAWARQQLFSQRLDAALRPHQQQGGGPGGFADQLVGIMEVDIRGLGMDPARWRAAAVPAGRAAGGQVRVYVRCWAAAGKPGTGGC
jgi:hypothetical protein